MIFALAGNPNCGKTTLFNALTGSNQHVGNFPGVTVEQRMGELRGVKGSFVVDLPGIYSMRTYTQEERIARDFLLGSRPDGIINIVDATNLERNLYLTLQLLELQVPMVLALNMMDEVHANGGAVDEKRISRALGIPVTPVSAARGEGIQTLLCSAVEAVRSWERREVQCPYPENGPAARCMRAVMRQVLTSARRENLPVCFCAARLTEGDEETARRLKLSPSEQAQIERRVAQMERETGMDRCAALADMRYAFLERLTASSVVQGRESRERARSRKIDRVLTGKYTALPLFFGVMLLVFWLTFGVIGKALSAALSRGIDGAAEFVDWAMEAGNVHPVLRSLVVDGIFAGVGSVLSFLPVIVTLFFFLSILEDTGYMARVAFVMDRPLRKLGLSGRSIVPLLTGFGCSVPAILATRTLAAGQDRKMTVMLIPYMSCSAKIPIYAAFSAAFFPEHAALAMMALYAAGIVLGILAALALKRTAFPGEAPPFIMELPNYRMPSLRNVCLLLWEKAQDFLHRAFTVIFLAAVIVWFLETFDARLHVAENASLSLLAQLGRLLAPVFAPLGFRDWRVATALLAGVMAKETVIGVLAVLSGSGVSGLGAALPSLFMPLSAVSFLLFTLLYTPCVAAVAAIRRELRSGLAAMEVAALQCGVAWAAAFLVYQLGSLI